MSILNKVKPIFLIALIVGSFAFISQNQQLPLRTTISHKEEAPFFKKKVTVQAQILNEKDSREILGKNLYRVGIVPVKVTIHNPTRDTLFLSTYGVDCQQKSSESVAMHVTACGMPKSIALKVAGLFFWPFLVPSAIDSIWTFTSHTEMKKDFFAITVKEEGEPLLPYSTVHRVLFVPKEELKEEFTLYLKNPKTNRFSPFPVTLLINS